MLRVCVIGLGPIGNLHATLHKADPLAELVGVCDINKQRADAAAARLGVPAFYDAQTMLDALKPDVCSIATAGVENGSDHYEVTLQAFEAGCHVLGEKPICNEIPKAEEMVAREGTLLRHRSEPSIHSGGPDREALAERGAVGRSALHQHGDVDHEPQ